MPFFSIVIPTRHRPEFIRESLLIISKQKFQDFEVIISDNFSDETLSCYKYFQNAQIKNKKYVKPPVPVGMVENWNFALTHAEGSYIIYLTDKMFLLPNTLLRTFEIIQSTNAEIVSWIDDAYTPVDYSDYFGAGTYTRFQSDVKDTPFFFYDPIGELNQKGIAAVSRKEQRKSEYIRGKICFGAYSKTLINRILDKYQKLFYNISPDYTSMILALSEAKTALEVSYPGIVHMNTNLSNGGLADISDAHALSFLTTLEDYQKLFSSMLVPGLYAANHNVVSHDYLSLKNLFQLPFEINTLNWLVYITEDLGLPNRIWSSDEVKLKQTEIYQSYINTLSDKEREYIKARLSERLVAKEKKLELEVEEIKLAEELSLKRQAIEKSEYESYKMTFAGKCRETMKSFVPKSILEALRKSRELRNNPPQEFEKSLLNSIFKYNKI